MTTHIKLNLISFIISSHPRAVFIIAFSIICGIMYPVKRENLYYIMDIISKFSHNSKRAAKGKSEHLAFKK